MEKGRRNALGVGDRILARTEERGSGHVAYPMKRLQAGGEMVVGVLVADTGPGGKPITWLRPADKRARSEEHTSELQSLMRISYAVFCLKKNTKHNTKQTTHIIKQSLKDI